MSAPMFDLPPRLPAGMPHRGLPAVSQAPTWAKYRPARPVRCEVCMRVLAETGGDGPLPRDARWKRRAAGQTVLLCHDHAQVQRHVDRMPALRVPPGGPAGVWGRR